MGRWCILGDCKFFVVLCGFTDGHRSAFSIDLGITNTFSKIGIFASAKSVTNEALDCIFLGILDIST